MWNMQFFVIYIHTSFTYFLRSVPAQNCTLQGFILQHKRQPLLNGFTVAVVL